MNEKYKLAFVVSLYFEYGGMQRTLMRLARECISRGHEVHVITGGWQGERQAGVHAHVIDTGAITNTGSNDKLAAMVRQCAADGGFDCLAGFTKIPSLDVYYAGDPCYAARVDATRNCMYKLLPRYHALKRQEAAVFSAGLDTEIMLIAHGEKEKFHKYYHTEDSRFHLLPPGINRTRLETDPAVSGMRTQLRHSLSLGEDQHVVLLVGSRFKTKGLDRALRAVAALPAGVRDKTRLVVVGDDKQAPYLRLARRLGITSQLVFAGAREDIAACYRMADMLLHPPYSENTGTVLIEAMYCGLPVLTTANCGFEFHVRKAGAGLVCPQPFCQQDLNANLSTMLATADKSTWSRNGIDYCKTTDLYSLIEKAADIIIDRARRNRQLP